MGKSVGGCYAEALAKRYGYGWGPSAERRFFGEKHWRQPLKWNAAAAKAGARSRVFCASMADVFEDRRDLDVWREKLWGLIGETPSLDWLLLTKRPENLTRFDGWMGHVNAWVGTTCEDQRYYDLRWPILARAFAMSRAAVSFVSHEPALGPLDIRCAKCGKEILVHSEAVCGDCPGVFPSWLITGGESGGGPREYGIEWARWLRTQTKGSPVRLFVKQLGANPWLPFERLPGQEACTPRRRLKLLDRAGADPFEWPPDLRVRDFPLAAEARP